MHIYLTVNADHRKIMKRLVGKVSDTRDYFKAHHFVRFQHRLRLQNKFLKFVFATR